MLVCVQKWNPCAVPFAPLRLQRAQAGVLTHRCVTCVTHTASSGSGLGELLGCPERGGSCPFPFPCWALLSLTGSVSLQTRHKAVFWRQGHLAQAAAVWCGWVTPPCAQSTSVSELGSAKDCWGHGRAWLRLRNHPGAQPHYRAPTVGNCAQELHGMAPDLITSWYLIWGVK